METLVLALAFAVPLCAYVAWKDLSAMEIPNVAVLAMVGLYAVFGALTLPLGAYVQGWVQGVVVLILGFALFQFGIIGGGDAKFAAAMAMFIGTCDGFPFSLVLLLTTILAVALHRILGRVPFIRRATSDWASWRARSFPMGLPMAFALVIYLCVAPFGGLSHAF